MLKLVRLGVALAGCFTLTTLLAAEKEKSAASEKGSSVLNFTMKNLAGEEVDLSKYKGKVVMIVNTASECGFTPQYKGLESLHEKYGDQGLVILGFPANDFGAQEPGSDKEIATFCKNQYNVQFDMFSKVVVKDGPGQCELYKFLTSDDTDPKYAGPVKWNFEKFIISRNGEIVGRYKSPIGPESAQVVKKIETELAKK